MEATIIINESGTTINITRLVGRINFSLDKEMSAHDSSEQYPEIVAHCRKMFLEVTKRPNKLYEPYESNKKGKQISPHQS